MYCTFAQFLNVNYVNNFQGQQGNSHSNTYDFKWNDNSNFSWMGGNFNQGYQR